MPLFRKVDCLRIYVPDLEAGLAFYRDQLRHKLIWRSATAAGLRLPETDTELVIQTEEQRRVLLDVSKGLLKTDIDGNVTGNMEA